MNGTASGIMTFGVKGGFAAGVKFYDALELFKRPGQHWRRQVLGMSPGVDYAPSAQ
jgi:hypothetical protein